MLSRYRNVPAGRASRRTPTKLPVSLLVDPEGKSEIIPCQAVDISLGGFRLKVDVALKPGEVVRVIPREGLQYAVSCHVVWVGKPGSTHEGEAGLRC